jgi:dihydrolipoamide dehydrogenase
MFEEVAHGAAAKFGVKTTGVEIDLPVLMGEKATAVKELTGGIEFLFKKNKIDWLKGYAQFKDAHTVEVAGTTYTAKHIVIATGSSVMPLPNVEVDNDAGIIVDRPAPWRWRASPSIWSSSAAA